MSGDHQPACQPIAGAPAAPRRKAALRWRDGGDEHIDVRGLPPPQPLVEVLRLVRTVATGTRIVVHHDRDPQLLYPELAELGWGASRMAAPAGEVRLLLQRLP